MTQERKHFGWWLYWKLWKKFNGDRDAIGKAMGLSYTRLRQYFHWEKSGELPPHAAYKVEQIFGLSPGDGYKAWEREPVPEPLRDPRGRRADSEPRTWRMKLVIPRELADELTAIAGAEGLSMQDAVIQACEDWAAAKRGSAPVIEPPAKQPRKPKGRKAKGGATGPGEKGLTSPA